MKINNFDNYVAIISPEFPPLTNWGGVATFNYNLSLLLNRIGKKVIVFTYDGVGSEEKVIKTKHATIIFCPLKSSSKALNFLYYKFPFGLIRYIIKIYFPELLLMLDWNVFSLLTFQKYKKLFNIKFIHSPIYHAPTFLISLIYRDIKNIMHAQGPQFILSKYEKPSFDKKIKSLLENLYVRLFSFRIIACSRNVKQHLIKHIPSLKDKLIYIPNFINIADSDNKTIDRNKIVFWGRLDFRKGVDILLKTFIKLAEKNNDIKLFLIGEKGFDFILKGKRISFDEYNTALNTNESIKKRIFIFPRINDKSSLYYVLKELKGIAVFPSRYEPFGFVNIEAMSLGYFTLTSVSGGGNEIVTDNINGMLFKPNAHSLTTSLTKALKLPNSTLLSIIKNAQLTVNDRFSLRIISKKYKSLIYDH